MNWNSRKHHCDINELEVQSFIASSSAAILLSGGDSNRVMLGGRTIKFSKLFGLGCIDLCRFSYDDDLEGLKEWIDTRSDLVLGYISYDLKNKLERLESSNIDVHGFSQFCFFVPEHVLILTNEGWERFSHSDVKKIDVNLSRHATDTLSVEMPVQSKDEYIHSVENLKQHIQFGDIYEVNYCVQHGFQNCVVEPFRLFEELQAESPAPFSCYVADGGNYLMSSSPERFIQKRGKRLLSQPIKGTNRRTKNNEQQIAALRNNAKEVAENVMITDLVRNDLSRSAKKGTVRVDELCEIYEFEHVNQMISTVSAELRDDVHPLDALFNAFPMGSMTGAPKIRAMELIDQFEDFSRGLYSGAVGYITPDLDFDFNVVIRSVLYNQLTKTVTFPTGGAITINSDPEKEYEECMLKAEAMRKVLMNHARKS